MYPIIWPTLLRDDHIPTSTPSFLLLNQLQNIAKVEGKIENEKKLNNTNIRVKIKYLTPYDVSPSPFSFARAIIAIIAYAIPAITDVIRQVYTGLRLFEMVNLRKVPAANSMNMIASIVAKNT